MNNLIRGLIAGYGAKKLGGGCFSTVLVFIVIWIALGMCGSAMPPADAVGADLASPQPVVLSVEAIPAR